MRTTAICILTVLLSICSRGSDLFREALPSETGVTWVTKMDTPERAIYLKRQDPESPSLTTTTMAGWIFCW